MLSLPSPLRSGVRPEEEPPPLTLEIDHNVVEDPAFWSPFKRWYMRHWATAEAEERQAWVQTRGSERLQSVLTVYFQIWSWPGEALYIILGLVVIVICGFTDKHGMAYALAVLFGICSTGMMKDRGECPRPRAPPVVRRFRLVHEHEFGFPSTHSCMALALGVPIAMMAYDDGQASAAFAIVACVFYVVHVAFSRYYLGAHYTGDILGGLVAAGFTLGVVYCLVPVLDEDVWQKSSPYLWWLPMVVGRLILVLQPTPRQLCPCVIDTARAVGSIAGVFAGKMVSNAFKDGEPAPSIGSVVHYPGPWLLAFLVAVLLAGLVEVFASPTFRFLLEPYFRFVSGECVASFPPALRQPYLYACVAFGLLSFRLPHSARRRNELAAECIEEAALTSEDAVSLASSRPQGSLLSERALRGRGVAWPLRLFGYWTEAQVMRRYWSYVTMCFVIMCPFPLLIIGPVFEPMK
uniref:Phosphatidic acid phosphatase type 2/haloperoxidase domain-containing protein n=1 Tax=Neobodo designis TaxID=312471 RepID=A0A7S1KYF1_NEODS|mmetsp:Transcript_11259/g.34983  ORF Transcript_11259/g.34983 Transcript_11259/m.34983 type:complete len:463 (+) Transcript_11259:53-1441(+)